MAAESCSSCRCARGGRGRGRHSPGWQVVLAPLGVLLSLILLLSLVGADSHSAAGLRTRQARALRVFPVEGGQSAISLDGNADALHLTPRRELHEDAAISRRVLLAAGSRKKSKRKGRKGSRHTKSSVVPKGSKRRQAISTAAAAAGAVTVAKLGGADSFPAKEASEEAAEGKEAPEGGEGASNSGEAGSDGGAAAATSEEGGVADAGGEATKEGSAEAATPEDAEGKSSAEGAGGAEGASVEGASGEGASAEGAGVETVKAGQQEDSGNSGVAEEMAVQDASAAAGAQPEGSSQPAQEEGGDAGAASAAAAEAGAAAGGDPVKEQELGQAEQLELEKSAHEDEERYATFMTDVMGIHQRLSPTLLGLKEKAAKHVLPKLISLAHSTRQAFQHTSKTLTSRMQPYVGEAASPLLATLLAYTLLVVPLVLVVYIVNAVRVIVTVRKALLLANLYLTLYCFGLLFACIIVGAEPMSSLRSVAESNFYALQAVEAAGYLLYLGLQVAHVVGVVRAKEKDSRFALLKSVFQLVAASLVGLHYYVTVFEPAMLDKTPNTGGAAYFGYCITFGFLTFLSRNDRKDDSTKQR